MKTKTIFFAVACALVVPSCGQKKVLAEGAADAQPAGQVEDAGTFTVSEISDGWKGKEIPVENGGKQPSIAKLLDAFNKVWPTGTYANLPAVEQGQSLTVWQFNRDSGGYSEIDLLEDYANVWPGDSYEDLLNSALWRRTNGHTLLGVYFREPEDQDTPQQVLCFYDYDPATQTLKPETDNFVYKFRPAGAPTPQYILPEIGTALVVRETDADYTSIYHVLEWDGMKFSLANSYASEELYEAVTGTWMSEDEAMPFTFKAVLVGDAPEGIYDCGIYGSTEYEVEFISAQGMLAFRQVPDDPDSLERPAMICAFYPTRDGKLRGGYYISQPGGREWRGIMTLTRQAE
ncbi:MAG: hypothetical protein IJ659_08060 [Alloprevotella sp.]|nr:hypothetical protein [Alloprevotella sp.]